MAAYGSVLRSDGRRQSPERLEKLKGFRTALYGCATRRADAWFELVDALLATERLVSLPHLSLEPVHRRGHGSLYAALRHGQVQAERLREVLATHLPAGPPVFAVDPTVWPRCDAECSPGRGSTTIPRGTRPASRSWRAGATSSSWAWSLRATPGPPRWTCAGWHLTTTATWSRPARSVACWTGSPAPPPQPSKRTSRCRWWSLTAALTRCSYRSSLRAPCPGAGAHPQ